MSEEIKVTACTSCIVCDKPTDGSVLCPTCVKRAESRFGGKHYYEARRAHYIAIKAKDTGETIARCPNLRCSDLVFKALEQYQEFKPQLEEASNGQHGDQDQL